MKKYVILSRLDSFDFPLYEATRKQVWWNAKKRKMEGYSVQIILLSNFSKSYIREDVEIKFVNRWLWNPLVKASKIQFINGSICIWLLFAIFFRGCKSLILTDGDMFGNSQLMLRRLTAKLLPLMYSEVLVYSKYQKERLNINKVNLITPILPEITVNPNFKKAEDPTLLYMGHLSFFKGVDTILESFKQLIPQYPNIKLIIANNSLRGDQALIDEVSSLKENFPENIILKGIVDPIKELTEAWVYLYPFKKAIGTMSFALSLYEAEICDTPYIACRVGANGEFFNPKYLIPVNDSNEMTRLIKKVINERKA